MRPATFDTHQLRPVDIALLRELNVVFGRAFGEPETYEYKPPDDAYLKDVLSKNHIIAIAALVQEEVVGGLVAYELEKVEQDRREFYIYDLAVAEEYRRRGVATALIEHLRGIAAARGAYVIFVQADVGDEPAIALYEKLAIRESALHFDIAVKTDGR